MSIYGPQWPLSKGEKDAFKMYAKKVDQARFEIKNLLLTSKGENLSDFSYGVGLRNFIFEMNVDSTRRKLENEIIQQMRRYLEIVNFYEIEFRSTPQEIDAGKLSVRIYFRLYENQQIEFVDISAY